MNFNINWTNNNYLKFLKFLKTKSNLKYKKFQSNILKDSKIKYIGIKTNFLRKIAKKIFNFDYKGFIKIKKNFYYEEIIIEGFIFENVKNNFLEFIFLIRQYSKKITNWALSDLPVKKFDLINNNKKKFLLIINEFLNSENFWIVRFGIIFLIKNYINKKYLKLIFKISIYINKKYFYCFKKKKNYYVKKSIAWLLTETYINFSSETLLFLKKNLLNKQVLKMIIQKINDSYRIDYLTKKKIKKILKNI